MCGVSPGVSLLSKVFDSWVLSLDFADGAFAHRFRADLSPISMIRVWKQKHAKRERARKVRGCWVLCRWEGLGGLTCDFWAENGKRKKQKQKQKQILRLRRRMTTKRQRREQRRGAALAGRKSG